ncbi:hypothetical protein C4J92_3583 [Pseudomonas sp. R3-18-08]|nr:hypothetical protein C4J92_3583 [Pseudomonas sp. R3-18-08]
MYEQFRKMGGISGYEFSELPPIKNYFIWNKHVKFHPAKDTFAALLTEQFKKL